MKQTKTKKQYEAFLNDLYGDSYSAPQAYDQFCYFNNGKVSQSTIYRAYNNHTLGSLLRKHDPIAFEVGYKEWARDES